MKKTIMPVSYVDRNGKFFLTLDRGEKQMISESQACLLYAELHKWLIKDKEK